MCIYDYIFHSCGHTSYKFAHPTRYHCKITNMCAKPSLEDTDEGVSPLLNGAVVLKTTCFLCQNGFVDPSKDPYLKNLAGIVILLDRALEEDPYDKSGHGYDLAREAVTLLSRMSEAYWACSESKPNQQEMRRYVIYAIQCVRKVVQSRNERIENENYCSQNLSEDHPELSLGTLERQLCMFSLSTQSEALPFRSQQHRLHRPQATSFYRTHAYNCSTGKPSRSIPKLRPILHLDTSYPTLYQTATTCSPREVKDTDSMATDPLTPALSLNSASMPISPLSLDSPVYRTHFRGRDYWDCDFCGLECFCWNIKE